MFGNLATANPNGWGLSPFAGPALMNYNIYSTQVSTTRLLYHSGLDLAIAYPLLPTKTLNFSRDLLPRHDHQIEKTLTSKRLTTWDTVVDDIVITETWEAPGGLAFPWEFFHDLHRAYTTCPDWVNGQYVLWRPLDRSEKAFAVELFDIEVDGQDFDVRWTGLPPSLQYTAAPGPLNPSDADCFTQQHGRDMFSPTTLTIKMLLRPETAPGVTLFMQAGCGTIDETTQFESE